MVHGDAPVHWWRCADPGGRVLNDIGSATAVPLGIVLDGSLPYSGPASDGGAAVFGRTSNAGLNQCYLAVPSHPFSLEAWLFPFDISNVGAVAFELQNGIMNSIAAGAAFLSLLMRTDGKFQFNFSGFGGNPSAIAAAASTFRAWHHVVGTYDGANLKLYVDGALSATTASAADASGSYDTIIGQTNGHVDSTIGLAELAYYSTALSGAQVAAHFAAADSAASFPVYKGGGSYPTSSFGTSSLLANILDVLNSVRKTY